METGNIAAMTAILTCFTVNSYRNPGGFGGSDSIHIRPDSAEIAIEQRFSPAKLKVADKSEFTQSGHYPNPF